MIHRQASLKAARQNGGLIVSAVCLDMIGSGMLPVEVWHILLINI